MNALGVILAGGKSTRMKQDKALLRLSGVSLLQHQFEALENLLGKGNVLVSGDRPEFPHIKDLVPHLGPLGALRSVCHHFVSAAEKKSVLIVPVDMPFVSYNNGLNRLVKHRTYADITKFVGHQLPIVIHNLEKILIQINNLCMDQSKRNLSLTCLFKHVQIEDIPAEAGGFFANINTPEDWNAAIS